MSSIHFIGGEKGGVGKSLTTRLLAQYFIDRSLQFAGFDTDRSHGTFSRFYAGFTASLDVEKFDSLDAILDMAETLPDTHLLVDLAAQTTRHLNRWMTDSDVFGIFAELKRPVYWWHVMDDGADSLLLLEKLLQKLPENVQLVMVQNQGRGENFTHTEQSTIYRQALAQGAHAVVLKKLQPALMQKIDFSGLSFWAAANNRELISLAERRRVAVWLEDSYAQFDRFLLPQEQGTAVNEQ
ncbi:MAG TPA: mobilization protein [Thiolinea sp.]|nr:mobilization protein [Thiolinea sp.]